MMRRFALSALVSALVAMQGCATGPRFDTALYDAQISPAEAVTDPERHVDRAFLWGGVIVNSANTPSGTQIEMLAYPLTSTQKPDTDRAPDGRFLVTEDRYLETLDYAPGRLLTVGGSMTGTRSGKIGDATYVYPVIQPDGLHLWPADDRRSNTQFHFGVGAVFGR